MQALAAQAMLSAMPDEGPWTIVGALAAIIAAAGVTYEFVIGPRLRHRALRRPCKAWFLIASTKQRVISHAVQDSREHYVEELVLASNSEYEIEFLYMPSIAFPVSEIYFGFNEQNDRDLDTKPTIKSFYNHFIERGTKEESPETHPETNYVDHHKFYHLRKPRTKSPSTATMACAGSPSNGESEMFAASACVLAVSRAAQSRSCFISHRISDKSHQLAGGMFKQLCRRRHQPSRPPPANRHECRNNTGLRPSCQ
jgi:hypothetical protein